MLTAKLISVFLLSVLALNTTASFGNVPDSSGHTSVATPISNHPFSSNLNSMWPVLSRGNLDGGGCELCGDPLWQPIHRCATGLSMMSPRINNDTPVIRSADVVIDDSRRGDHQKLPVTYWANRWAIGSIGSREIAESVTKYP